MSVASVLAIVLAATGSALVLLAAVGLVRMPDLFTRMQAASKASTLGAASILAAVAVRFGDLGIGVQDQTTELTGAGYRSKVPMSPDSPVNDLEGRFDGSTGALRGLDGSDEP